MKHPLLRLFSYSDELRGTIFLATLYSVLNKFFDILPPLLVGIAIDVVVLRGESFLGRLGISNLRDQLIAITVITVFVHIFESLFEYLAKLRWREIAQTLEHEIRMDAYEHVQGLEMAYFEDRSTGGLISILNDDVNQLERFLDSGAFRIVGLIVSMTMIGGWFAVVAPQIAWVAILPMPMIVAGSFLYQRLLAPRYADVREKVGILNGQLSNNLSGIGTIKSYATEAYEVERLGGHSDAYRQSNFEAIKYSAAFNPLMRMAVVFGFAGLMLLGGLRTLNGTMAVGLFSAMMSFILRLLWPMTALAETLDLYQRAVASINRLLNLLDTKPGFESGAIALPTQGVAGEVVFEDVSFGYGDGLKVLQNINMTIPAGHTVAFVGSTGSGKSTLIKLILRFYDVTQGRITVDGVDVRELDTADLRRAIGLVSQDVYLFHGSAEQNIQYGTFNTTFEQIIDAARIAEAHAFIQNLAEGYSTVVGERGQKLSGGQRQRISLARAVLKDPPILVLDEATSAVDNETEAAIQRSMEKIAVGRTTIMIAHRLSTVRNANAIYVVDEGKITESGTHEELVNLGGIYADLWRIQTGELTG